jgi:hypothetical protein
MALVIGGLVYTKGGVREKACVEYYEKIRKWKSSVMFVQMKSIGISTDG